MGNTKHTDEMAYDDEKPQQKLNLPAYRISKYLITNAQYDAFVRDGGYTAKRWRACWTAAGLKWKGDRTEPEKYGGVFDLPNHPVVGVTWYEALAFCGWLSEKLGHPVALPTEAQWEKAARGPPLPLPVATEGGELLARVGAAIPGAATKSRPSTPTTTRRASARPAPWASSRGRQPVRRAGHGGNAWEWCLTRWREDYTHARRRRPGRECGACVARGRLLQ